MLWNVIHFGVWFLIGLNNIFLRASKVLNDNCFEKGGSYSIHVTKLVLVWMVYLLYGSFLKPASSSLLSVDLRVSSEYKHKTKMLVLPVFPSSFFSLQAMTVLAKPNSGGQGRMKVVSQYHRWYPSSHQAAGGASQPALLGPCPSWKPRVSE